MIHLENISRKFASTNALSNINLKIKEGEFMALIGHSGSGKSTLLNLIGGLDTPTEGSIFIKNEDISEYDDKKLSYYRNNTIGFIFQEFQLKSFLTVKKNVLLPSHFNHHSKHDEIYAEKLIKEVGLATKIDSNVNELSGGQKQRAAIARALINHPTIILADEPTGNLDLKTGETIIQLLKYLHKTHKTTLIIATHDPLVAKAADRIIHLQEGQIIK